MSVQLELFQRQFKVIGGRKIFPRIPSMLLLRPKCYIINIQNTHWELLGFETKELYLDSNRNTEKLGLSSAQIDDAIEYVQSYIKEHIDA